MSWRHEQFQYATTTHVLQPEGCAPMPFRTPAAIWWYQPDVPRIARVGTP